MKMRDIINIIEAVEEMEDEDTIKGFPDFKRDFMTEYKQLKYVEGMKLEFLGDDQEKNAIELLHEVKFYFELRHEDSDLYMKFYVTDFAPTEDDGTRFRVVVLEGHIGEYNIFSTELAKLLKTEFDKDCPFDVDLTDVLETEIYATRTYDNFRNNNIYYGDGS